MSYNISWLIDQRILHQQLTDKISLDDVQTMNVDIINYLRSANGDHKIHLLTDASKLIMTSMSLKDLNKLVDALREPNVGWVLLVTDNKFVKFMTNTLVQLASNQVHVFENIESAIEFIKIQDKTINWSQMTMDI